MAFDSAQNVKVTGELVIPDPEVFISLLPFSGSAVTALSTVTAETKLLGASHIEADLGVVITAQGDSRATPLTPGLSLSRLARPLVPV